MSTSKKIAVACHLLCIVMVCAMGMAYLVSPHFMPYHQRAVGVDWSRLPPRFQAAVLSSMRAVGGGFLAAGVSLLILLLVPFQQGQRWAVWAMLAVSLAVGLPALYSLVYLQAVTGARAPIPAMAVWLVSALAAFVLAWRDSSKP